MDSLTDAELEEWREIIQMFPKEERDKWQLLAKSNSLYTTISFMDNTLQFFEHLGRMGMWLNKILKGILFLFLFVLLVKVWITGEVTLNEIWKVFFK